MKAINNILELIGITALALLLYTLIFRYIDNTWWKLGLCALSLIFCIILYILSSKYEKRLESKLDEVMIGWTQALDLVDENAELTKQYRNLFKEAEQERDEWKEKYEKLDFERRYEEKIPDGTSSGDVEDYSTPDTSSGFEAIGDPYIPLPFAENIPYIGQWVEVTYGGKKVETQITKILDEGENGLRYRCYKCGSKKYKAKDMVAIGDTL